VTPLLRAEHISVRYDGVRALSDVDVQVHAGELVGLIGPNGAGKTTFIDAVSGFVSTRGRVELDGGDISFLSPDQRAGLGLTRTWQSGDLFHELTVRENLRVATAALPLRERMKEAVLRRDSRNHAVDGPLALLRLGSVVNYLPDQLTQAQRKLVGVARALQPNRELCVSTSLLPASTVPKPRRSVTFFASSQPPALDCCSSTTTWGWC